MKILPGVTLERVPVCANTKFRDEAGFCLLTNRCWDGKPCPTSARAAERARDELVSEAARRAIFLTWTDPAAEARDSERMLRCELLREAGAKPAERERLHMRRAQVIHGEEIT